MKILQITMFLKNLIKNISKNNRNKIISGLATNSKEIKKNFMFFAIKGNKINGEKFISHAIKKGQRAAFLKQLLDDKGVLKENQTRVSAFHCSLSL